MKTLKIALISVVLGNILFATDANLNNNKKTIDIQKSNLTKANPLFNQIEKEIYEKRKIGLFPINSNEKKEIEKIVKVPEKYIRFYGKKATPYKKLIEYVLIIKGSPVILYKNIEDKNNPYYIAGYIFNKKGENITVKEAKDEFGKITAQQFKRFFKEIKEKAKDFVIEINGEGKGEVVIYTDPQCPYCKRFEEQFGVLEHLKKKFKKIYVVEYPLSFHNEAAQRTFWIIENAKGKSDTEKINIIKQGSVKAYSEIVEENKKKNIEKYKKKLEEMRKIETPARFGTPSITDINGKDIREEVIKDIMSEKFHINKNQIQ